MFIETTTPLLGALRYRAPVPLPPSQLRILGAGLRTTQPRFHDFLWKMLGENWARRQRVFIRRFKTERLSVTKPERVRSQRAKRRTGGSFYLGIEKRKTCLSYQTRNIES